MFGSQLTEGQALSIFEHLAERNGVRATARLVKVNRNTVVRYARLAGGHARQLHDELVAFSPNTREVQFDEKWSFVFKKQEHCDPADPADDQHGDWWDHVAMDPESRLVLAVVPGARDAEAVEEVVGEVKDRTGGRVIDLVTSDDYPAYETALLEAYGQEVTTTAYRPAEPPDGPQEGPAAGDELRHGREEAGEGPRGRGHHPGGLRDDGGRAERRWRGRRSAGGQRLVPGAAERHRPAPQRAEGPQDLHVFSKDWRVHEAMTYFTMYSYNFCWPVRTLTERDDEGTSDGERRRWRRGWPTTSGRCASGSRCRAFNAVKTPSRFQTRTVGPRSPRCARPSPVTATAQTPPE